MPRAKATTDDLAAIAARREALLAELARIDEQAKIAKEAARDAGRPVLMAALERVKIGTINKSDARAIASAIASHGGRLVAERLAELTAG